MRPFGCPVTILNTIDHLGKFDGKADEGFFIGYSLNCKAFRVFNSRTRIVKENLHIRFSENTPNVVDTQSNGFAGTKASDNAGQLERRQNFDVGKKVDVKIQKKKVSNDQDKEDKGRIQESIMHRESNLDRGYANEIQGAKNEARITTQPSTAIPVRESRPSELPILASTRTKRCSQYILRLKKCLSDESLVIPLEEIQVDDKLNFIE
ncbi:retrovirus-related pol polyprotein from transposon TNT 1-94 [Tanacetum coccineum]